MKEGGAENEEDEGNRVPPPPPGRPDRTLRDFLGKMDTYAPIIPDAVTNHYLSQAGFSTPDPRLSRLLALATQKFVSDLATSAYQHSRIRTSGVSNVGEGAVGVQGGGRRGKERKSVLTMEDLQGAVAEWGVNLKRGEFYR
ncbi:transcription initiation factor IID, TAF10 subunit [Saitoella complicata NRRL Y-17804]|uniref:transcription initiation factor IID, TAF10 subunit n=1 Tax=Saitoella complicata (strain BCRC 22490 / CBS 7301 / JCM 7358 / NBRC 10748 / NRRL Y-17804) TaxID=698492 RepID=UPI000866D804|nr:transcription initiation factor IID, TAF10 subunit [Saitoella complicata NRRL Y-17804]ODQ52022.1 transcription initiation factor IID, TAF10 subunit [Saitoella complicata NRRL Y-17804]